MAQPRTSARRPPRRAHALENGPTRGHGREIARHGYRDRDLRSLRESPHLGRLSIRDGGERGAPTERAVQVTFLELSRSRGGGTCKLSRTGEPKLGAFCLRLFRRSPSPFQGITARRSCQGFARFARRLRRPGHNLRAVMRVTMGDGRTGASGRGSGLRVLHGKPAAVNSLASNPFPLFFRATGARRD